MTVFYFGYNSTNPLPSIATIDAREMPNQYDPNKSDEEIRMNVREHPLFNGLVMNTIDLQQEYNHVAVGCSFGIHRSRAVAEHAAYLLNTQAEPWTQFSPV